MKLARFKEFAKNAAPVVRAALYLISVLSAVDRILAIDRPRIKSAKNPIVWSRFAAYRAISTHSSFAPPCDRQASLVINPHALLADTEDRSVRGAIHQANRTQPK